MYVRGEKRNETVYKRSRNTADISFLELLCSPSQIFNLVRYLRDAIERDSYTSLTSTSLWRTYQEHHSGVEKWRKTHHFHEGFQH